MSQPSPFEELVGELLRSPQHHAVPYDLLASGRDDLQIFAAALVRGRQKKAVGLRRATFPEGASAGTALRTWVASNVDGPSTPPRVLLDTTTLVSATAAIVDDERLCAFRLWDLVVFVEAVVFNERVFCIKSADLGDVAERVNEALGNRQIVVPVDLAAAPPEVSATVIRLWEDVIDRFEDLERARVAGRRRARDLAAVAAYEEAAAIVEAWTRLLGDDVPDIALYDHDYLLGFDSPSLRLIEQITDMHSPSAESGVWNAGSVAGRQTVMECTMRGTFNFALAAVLGVPYWPNSFRTPVRAFLLRRGIEWVRALTAAEVIESEYRARASRYLRMEDVTLPMAFGSLVARIDDRRQLWEELARLRELAAPLRLHLGALERAYGRLPEAEVGKLAQAIKRDAAIYSSELRGKLVGRALMGAVGATIVKLVPSVTQTLSGYQLAAAALIGAGLPVMGELLTPLVERALHPAHWFLTDTANAALFAGQRDRMARLWRLPHDTHFARQLLAFAELGGWA